MVTATRSKRAPQLAPSADHVVRRVRRRLPAAVVQLLRDLQRVGLSIFLVGGAVRDAACGLPAADWDLVVASTLTDLARRVPKGRVLGGTHPLLLVPVGSQMVHLSALFGAGDGAGLAATQIHTLLHHDLQRRDFTVNAMAVDLQTMTLQDPTGGLRDLHACRLRTPAQAEDILRADPVRIVRALRLRAAYGLQPNTALTQALKAVAPALAAAVPERLRDALIRLWALPASQPATALHAAVALGAQSGVWQHIEPELGPLRAETVRALGLSRPLPLWARLGAWAAGQGASPAHGAALAERLRLSTREQALAAAVVTALAAIRGTSSGDGHRGGRLSDVDWRTKIGPLPAAARSMAAELQDGARRRRARRQARRLRHAPMQLQQLRCDGHALLGWGVPQAEMGQVFKALLDAVRAQPALNHAATLRRLALAHLAR